MCGGRDTHGGTVVLSVGLGAVPAQEQAAQIRHRITENREQFRVRAQGLGKGLRAWRGSGNGQLLQEAGRSWIFHKSNWKEKHQISCIHLVIGIEHSRYNSFRLR